MKKKLLCIALCLVMVAAAVCALVACEDDAIVVWVGEGTKEFTEQKLKEWNETNEYDVKFNFKVEMVSESKAAGDAIQKQQSAADIFCFAQDQLARLVESGLLAPLNATSQQAVTDSCDDGSIAAATINGTIRAFPMTADNGYFMYYDKRVITADVDETSLESLIAACEAAGKKFSMNLTKDGGSWYAASFFYATDENGDSLCKSEWTVNENGKFTKYDDNFRSDNGVIALKGMQKLLLSSCHQDSADVGDFNAANASAVVISGIWDYNAAKTALSDQPGDGKYLGVAALPSFEVDGNKYEMRTYLGSKLVGVKRQSDATQAILLQKVAMYLTSEAVQQARFELVGWGPSNKNLQDSAAVKASVALSVLHTEGKTVLQGQYPTNWWAKVEALTLSAKTATTDGALLAILSTYKDGLDSLKNG